MADKMTATLTGSFDNLTLLQHHFSLRDHGPNSFGKIACNNSTINDLKI